MDKKMVQIHCNLSKSDDSNRDIYLCLAYLEGDQEAEEELSKKVVQEKKGFDPISCNQKLVQAAGILKRNKFCPKCGRFLKAYEKKCSVCDPDKPPKITKILVPLIIACVAAVCIVIGIRMNQSKIEVMLPDSWVEKFPWRQSSDEIDKNDNDTEADNNVQSKATQAQQQSESQTAPSSYVATETTSTPIDLDGVTELDMRKSGISDLSIYSSADSLESLNLYGNPFSDLQPIAGLTNLKKLVVSNTEVYSIEPLSGLVNLEELSFGETQVSDISPVKNLVNLKTIDFWKTPVSDISVLSELTKLEFVSISYTNVSDLSALMNLSNLSELGMQGLSISKDQYDEFVKKHPNCKIYDTGTIYY